MALLDPSSSHAAVTCKRRREGKRHIRSRVSRKHQHWCSQSFLALLSSPALWSAFHHYPSSLLLPPFAALYLIFLFSMLFLHLLSFQISGPSCSLTEQLQRVWGLSAHKYQWHAPSRSWETRKMITHTISLSSYTIAIAHLSLSTSFLPFHSASDLLLTFYVVLFVHQSNI